MRRLLIALLAACLLPLHAAEPNASYGEHGMALFGGRDALYASHLPMFHAPHDVQMVLRFHLADAAQDAALRARLDGKTSLWTIAPEKFELDRLAQGAANPLRQFKADLVLGHFEQGGKVQMAGVTLVVEQVLVYRKLSPLVRQAATLHYLPVGRFLVKEIDSRPDFDHIVAVDGMAKALRLPRTGMGEPSSADLAGAGVSSLGTIYFYTEDLR